MKFAIKHARPHYFLQKHQWFWSNTLDETTVYTGSEVVERIKLEANNLREVQGEVKIVVVRAVKVPAYEEVVE